MNEILKDIENAAIDGSASMSTLLRKCAVLADRLDNAELRSWVNHELNGYAGVEDLPRYRVIPAVALGNLTGPFNSGYKNITIPPIMLPEKARPYAERVDLRQTIAELEAIVESKESLYCPWPGNLIAHMQDKFNGYVLYGAWQQVSASQVRGVVDTVRNRVLDFVLQLRKAQPDAGEKASASTPVEDATVTRLLHQIVIHGDVFGNVAAGNHVVQSSGAIAVSKGDLGSLERWLQSVGVPDDDIRELKEAVTKDPPAATLADRPRTSQWITKVMEKTGSGTLKLAGSVTAGMIVRALAAYCGI